MDRGNSWASYLAAAKRPHSSRHHQSLHYRDWPLSLDDLEGDDDFHIDYYTCPFCNIDFDIASLCTHIEEEHNYESNPAACPICAAKVGRDIVGHISRQHGHAFKIQRRRRSQKLTNSANSANSTLFFLGKELREAHLQTLLGGSRTSNNAPTAIVDSLLSSFVCNVPVPEVEDTLTEVANDEIVSKSTSSRPQHKPSYEASLTSEERERKYKEDTLRSKFVRQLVLSTIFDDS